MKQILLAAALLVLALPAFAQTVEQDGAADPYGLKTGLAERIFLKYHKAIDLEQSCNNRSFSPADKQAMEETIAGRMAANSPNVAVGAARLISLRKVADDQANSLASKQGCDGDEVKKLLQFFDERLGSVVAAQPQQAAPADTAAAPEPLTTQGQ